jgi:hypothetical protein
LRLGLDHWRADGAPPTRSRASRPAADDARLIDLYANCDMLALLTEADLVRWVLLDMVEGTAPTRTS